VPIIFKGSGFYVTDHKTEHGHSAPLSSDKAEETPKAKTGSTETKAKAGTEAKAKSKDSD